MCSMFISVLSLHILSHLYTEQSVGEKRKQEVWDRTSDHGRWWDKTINVLYYSIALLHHVLCQFVFLI